MNKISEKILADARKEADEITDRARHEEEDLVKAKEITLADATAKHVERLAAIYSAEFNRQTALAEIEFRKSILKAKKALLAQIFHDVPKHLLKPERYSRFLEAMILRGVVSGGEEIIVSEKDRYLLDDEFIRQVNKKAAEQTGHATHLHLAPEARETGGGLFLRAGKIEFNAAMATVMQSISEEMEMELARLLFSEGA